VQATLHWVSAADAITAEVRLYNQLFNRPDPDTGDFTRDINAESLEVLTNCRLERALASVELGENIQFERQGYFCRDIDSTTDRPVFNRTVGLRDSWAKVRTVDDRKT